MRFPKNALNVLSFGDVLPFFLKPVDAQTKRLKRSIRRILVSILNPFDREFIFIIKKLIITINASGLKAAAY
ncbi:hypothetical protein H7U19_05520 [Hyunsoonleella sp. SJ7]|uniref:Uncharacterized protein n=1 Tax=Hyunsoonleella aquatilis TaxID=2762758 RepID=A0A923KI39_9FLAO|nr:hypothetical protein [Hyunsoonleella aquatilis]MBC3757854.1 hypothetical protein [Hyunsoonleella aquatilis]